MILVGYQDESANYRLYSHETKKVIVSRDVIFHELAGTRKTGNSEGSGVEFIWPNHPEELKEDSAAEIVEESIIAHREEIDEDTDNNRSVVDSEKSDNDGSVASNEKTFNKERKQQSGGIDGTRTLRNRTLLKSPARYEMNLAEYHVPETFEEAISGPESTN